jgi:TolB-like protein
VIEAKKAAAKETMSPSFQDKPSIVVLPFVNLSNDPKQEYFSDGMTEELIGALAKLEGLKVISRTSAFYFKGAHVDLRTIGEKLKVDNVLEGSVRKAGNKLRITAQLINVADDTHLWAESYNRELEDVFAIQEEISLAIMKNLKIKLLYKEEPKLVRSYTENLEAYNLYLEGRFFQSKMVVGYNKAEEYYKKTIDIEPEYAPAYISLAQIYLVSASIFSTPPDEFFPKYLALCLKAIDIDPNLVEAHSALGIYKATHEYDWPGAERSLKRAIDLNPGIPVVHYSYAVYLAALGRVNEAIATMKRSLVFSISILSIAEI